MVFYFFGRWLFVSLFLDKSHNSLLLFQVFLIKERNVIAPYKTVRVSIQFCIILSKLIFSEDQYSPL